MDLNPQLAEKIDAVLAADGISEREVA